MLMSTVATYVPSRLPAIWSGAPYLGLCIFSLAGSESSAAAQVPRSFWALTAAHWDNVLENLPWFFRKAPCIDLALRLPVFASLFRTLLPLPFPALPAVSAVLVLAAVCGVPLPVCVAAPFESPRMLGPQSTSARRSAESQSDS